MVLDRMVVAQEAEEWDHADGMPLWVIIPTVIILEEIGIYLGDSLEDSSIEVDMDKYMVEAMAEDMEICREEDMEGREDEEGGNSCLEVWEGMGSFLILDLVLAHFTQ